MVRMSLSIQAFHVVNKRRLKHIIHHGAHKPFFCGPCAYLGLSQEFSSESQMGELLLISGNGHKGNNIMLLHFIQLQYNNAWSHLGILNSNFSYDTVLAQNTHTHTLRSCAILWTLKVSRFERAHGVFSLA